MTDSGARLPARDGRPVRKPLSGRALVLAAVVVVVLTALVVLVLWWPATKGLTNNELVSARFEALRIGLSIGLGSGGVIVLYLAWRRQQAMEDTLAHQERVADTTEADARERRITDLYTKAADQLGSDKAAVRLAGLYALERLAQDHPKQRPTIVNVLCAYLRMPFDLPTEPPPLPDDSAEADAGRERERYRELLADHRERVQEREVRHTAQRLLSIHSKPGPSGVDDPIDTYWPNLELDLTGATLDAPDFRNCHINTISLNNARISGAATFYGAEFAGDAMFDGAEFAGYAMFGGAKFTGDARFGGAEFAGDAMFDGVKFAGDVTFRRAKFTGDARFGGAEFAGDAVFGGAEFAGDAMFGGAKFIGDVRFGGAEFAGDAGFGGAEFAGDAGFGGAKFAGYVGFGGARFAGYVGFRETEFTDNPDFDKAEFAREATFGGAKFAGGIGSHRAGPFGSAP